MSRFRVGRRWHLVVPTIICHVLPLLGCSTEVPPLPAGAQTDWRVDQPEEIVTWVLFDPATVEDRRPKDLRFVRVEELATAGVERATNFVSEYPSRKQWGVSFLEIVRSRTFTIDGRSPSWSEGGAAGLWFALVSPTDSTTDLGAGRPILALEVWMPDSTYVAYMRKKGHYATVGDVTLVQNAEEAWQGDIRVDGLRVVAECVPTGGIRGGADASGRQTIIPPRSSRIPHVVRISYAGHRIQECADDKSWRVQGSHPLASGVVVGPAEFQYGYDLRGGAYAS